MTVDSFEVLVTAERVDDTTWRVTVEFSDDQPTVVADMPFDKGTPEAIVVAMAGSAVKKWYTDNGYATDGGAMMSSPN